jgi:hypothetical protein
MLWCNRVYPPYVDLFIVVIPNRSRYSENTKQSLIGFVITFPDTARYMLIY